MAPSCYNHMWIGISALEHLSFEVCITMHGGCIGYVGYNANEHVQLLEWTRETPWACPYYCSRQPLFMFSGVYWICGFNANECVHLLEWTRETPWACPYYSSRKCILTLRYKQLKACFKPTTLCKTHCMLHA